MVQMNKQLIADIITQVSSIETKVEDLNFLGLHALPQASKETTTDTITQFFGDLDLNKFYVGQLLISSYIGDQTGFLYQKYGVHNLPFNNLYFDAPTNTNEVVELDLVLFDRIEVITKFAPSVPGLIIKPENMLFFGYEISRKNGLPILYP